MFRQNSKKKPTTKHIPVRERGNPYLRFFDRYLGILLIFFLSLFKRSKRFPPFVESIALLKTAGIGDTILLSAIVYDLQKAYPSKKITLFTGNGNFEMGKLIHGIEVVKLPITSPMQALSLVRKNSFSLWIDCDPWPRISALFSFFSRSEYRMGFTTSGQYRHFLYDRIVIHQGDVHELENYRQLLREIDLPISNKPEISFPHPIEKKNQVALHLFPGGSQASLKMWKEENWKELMTFLLDKGYEIVLTGGNFEWSALENLTKYDSRIKNMAGKSLKETAELLLSSRCLISVDTGIMHLGAALSCPVIALHGPTSPKRWGGIGDKVIALTPPLAYKPCISLGFEKQCKKNSCMESIPVSMVKTAFLKIETL